MSLILEALRKSEAERRRGGEQVAEGSAVRLRRAVLRDHHGRASRLSAADQDRVRLDE